MGRIQGKVAMITGAASGMGRATALRFAKEGASVVLTDLNSQGGETAVAECAAAGGRAVFQRTDVTSEADIKAAVDRGVKEYGRLDIMFNNAGVGGAMGPIEKVASGDWDRTMAILLRAVFLGMKYSIPEMRKGGGGSIISTASVAGLRAAGYLAAYSAAKAAVVNLTQAVAIEVGHRSDPRQLHLPRRSEYAAGARQEARRRRSGREEHGANAADTACGPA